MWICAVYGCENRSQSKSNLIFRSFPNPGKEMERFKTWIEACGNEDLFQFSPRKVAKMRICNRHFDLPHPLMNRLPKNVNPSLHVPAPVLLPPGWLNPDTVVSPRKTRVTSPDKSMLFPLSYSSVEKDEFYGNVYTIQNSNGVSAQRLKNVQTHITNIQNGIKDQSNQVTIPVEKSTSVPWYITSESAPKTYSKYFFCNKNMAKNLIQSVENPKTVLAPFAVASAHGNATKQVASNNASNDAELMDVLEFYDEELNFTENKEDDERLRTHCRICALECTDMKNIFEKSNKDILEMLKICTDIEFLETDFLPKQICDTCIAEVTACHKFKLKSNKSDIFLRELFLDVNNDDNNTQEQNDENELKCKTCGMVSKTYAGFELHKSKYTEDPCDFCVICNKTIQHSMQKHMSVHKGHRPYKCLLCGRAYLSRGTLMDHQNVHRQTGSFKCAICKKSYDSRRELSFHQKVHKLKERTYLCSICGAKFATSKHFKTHNRKHAGDKSIECRRCNKKFYSTTQRAKHLRSYCVNTNSELSLCFVCGEVCSNQPELEEHFLKHIDRKLYNCRICGMEFSYNKEFNSHINTHTGPFECFFCNKSFHESSVLTTHYIRAHRFCEICDKTFMSIKYLKGHQRDVHSQNTVKKKDLC